jgi:hypothetical protein
MQRAVVAGNSLAAEQQPSEPDQTNHTQRETRAMAATLILIDVLLDQISMAVSADEAAYWEQQEREADDFRAYYEAAYSDF